MLGESMSDAEDAIERLVTTEDDAGAILRYYYFDRKRLSEARSYFGSVIDSLLEADVTKASMKKELQQAMAKVLKKIGDPAKQKKMKDNMQKSMDIVVGWVPA